jgi:integrase
VNTDDARPLKLTAMDRRVLAKARYDQAERMKIRHLYAPFEEAFLRHTLSDSVAKYRQTAVNRPFRMCARIMLEFDCTYWAFTWEQLLAWREEQRRLHADHSAGWREWWNTTWTQATSTLFFLEVLPYREETHRQNYLEIAQKWLGKATARALEDQFAAMAKVIGYRNDNEVRERGARVVLAVLTAKRTSDLASITKADLEQWEAETKRAKKVARVGVTIAQKVLAAMGYSQSASPRLAGGGDSRARATWGRTAPAIIDTCERFMADLGTTRRPGTMEMYETALRRFGDWLGHVDPAVRSVADVRRSHIEAYKQALMDMKIGDYTSALRPSGLGPRRGRPMGGSYRARCLSCVRVMFGMIEVLEYPERPGRQLFIRGDVARRDHELPRFILDPHWHRILEVVEGLTPELVTEHRLPLPYERARAILAVLLECGLRAGELCRLDTGCVLAAQDEATGAVTHWLRVPIGKLQNDRMIPIRPSLVETLDAWMRRRGPQPPRIDERTNTMRDFLFTWQGVNLSLYSLNEMITRLCTLARVPRTTSHPFRHTLAVQWRRSGMKIETISQMLGHHSLRMTMRYAAVMPETLRREFDSAFAAIDEEHRGSAQVRVMLSPEAHMAASAQWRESLWVDLGIGFCGLSAYLPCEGWPAKFCVIR